MYDRPKELKREEAKKKEIERLDEAITPMTLIIEADINDGKAD